MKTWFCVTSAVDNRGRMTAAVTAARRRVRWKGAGSMIDDLISRLVKMQPTEDDWVAANRVVLDVIEAPPRKLATPSLVFYAYMCGVMQERARQKEKAAYGRGQGFSGLLERPSCCSTTTRERCTGSNAS